MNQDNIDTTQPFFEGAKMQEQHKTLRLIIKAIFESTQSSIFLVDPDYNIIFLNKKARDGCKLLFGKEAETGDSILNYRDKNDEAAATHFKENFAKVLQGNTIVNERKLNFPASNAWVKLEYIPVYDDGEKIIGVVIKCADISERKNYELQIDKQRERLEKLAWMQSHETRQPVATILGLINILDKGTLTAENIEIVTMLEKTVDKLDTIIHYMVTQANTPDGIYGK